MKDYCEPFRGKKITLLGLGLLGRGVGDAEFLATCGAELIVTDKKSGAELASSVEQLKQHKNTSFKLGGHDIGDFTKADMIIKAAGVPLDSPEIAATRAAGVPVYMSTALFAKYAMDAGAKIVGITGTRGKSTITQMIAYVLIRANKKVVVGGNVRGVSTLALLPQVNAGDICVLELDSWQLQGFGDLEISPHIAVFTNLMPDHQNYYLSMEAYFEDKANIFRYQKNQQGDALLVGRDVLERVKAARPPVAPHVPAPIPHEWKLKVIGEHNRENASFAAAALKALGLSAHDIRSGLESFEAVEGRLQFVREIGGVKIYNDNNATTPEATVAALRSLSGDITLITGGSEKGLALEELVSEIKMNVSRVIVLTHPNYQGSARLAQALTEASVGFQESTGLSKALDAAMQTKTATVLFSPAFASFGMFKNEYERNDAFVRLVKAL